MFGLNVFVYYMIRFMRCITVTLKGVIEIDLEG